MRLGRLLHRERSLPTATSQRPHIGTGKQSTCRRSHFEGSDGLGEEL